MLSTYSLETGLSPLVSLDGAARLAGLRESIVAIHEQFRPRLVDTGIHEYLESRNEADLSIDVRTRLNSLRQDMKANLIDQITSPEALEILEERKKRIEKGGQFKGRKIVLLDVDGTLTDPVAQANRGYSHINYEDPLLLGSGLFDTLMCGDGSLRVIFHAVGWGELIGDYPQLYHETGLHLPLRQGILELFDYAKTNGIETNFLTTNFRPLIEGLRSKIPGAEVSKIYAIDFKSVMSTLKGSIAKLVAVLNPESPIDFFGDGKSDKDIFEAKDQLQAIHTLKDSFLDKLATELGIAHLTFSDGFDMIENLKKSSILKQRVPWILQR